MEIKYIRDEDFTNYKKPSMVIAFPRCSFKCDKECGQQVCQNSELAKSKTYDCSLDFIVNRYMSNNLTSSIVFGGLEPFDTPNDLLSLIAAFRAKTEDDIVIYTGYYESEIEQSLLDLIKKYKNIIIKFGRFIPNMTSIYDNILGINLASNNQFAVKIS